MSLTRVWTPSGNYSGGGTKRLLVIHTMEGFTGVNGAYDCAKYFQGDVGASSQVCIDNNRGKIWECVNRGYGSWTQCQFNYESDSAEQSGYASWSTDYWLSNRDAQLHNLADWIAEEAKKLGIPITLLSDSQAQGSGWGVTFHSRLGSSGCGHSDPGSKFPIDQVLEWAKSGGSPAQDTREVIVADVEFDASGRPWEVGSWADNGQINVKVGDSPFAAIDDTQTGALGSPGIAYDKASDRMRVVYINSSGKMCAYTTKVTPIDWAWDELGGKFKG